MKNFGRDGWELLRYLKVDSAEVSEISPDSEVSELARGWKNKTRPS